MFSTGFDVLTTNTSPLDPVIMHYGLVLNDIILIFVKLNTRLFENLNLSAGFFSRLTRSPLISSGSRPALLRGWEDHVQWKNNASNSVKKTYKGGYQTSQSNTSTLARFLSGGTSRKRPPRTQKVLSGHLREVVAYKNRATGVLFREDRSTFWTRVWYMHFLSLKYVQPHVLAERSSFTMSSVVHKANMEIKPCVKWSFTKGLKQLEQ